MWGRIFAFNAAVYETQLCGFQVMCCCWGLSAGSRLHERKVVHEHEGGI